MEFISYNQFPLIGSSFLECCVYRGSECHKELLAIKTIKEKSSLIFFLSVLTVSNYQR